MDFLTFKSFISIKVLILFYYMGAIMIPLFLWFFSSWLIKKFHLLSQGVDKGKQVLSSTLTLKQKVLLTSFFIACFLFMQIIWRMMFEFLIAFMQMRDALVLH